MPFDLQTRLLRVLSTHLLQCGGHNAVKPCARDLRPHRPEQRVKDAVSARIFFTAQFDPEFGPCASAAKMSSC